MKKAKRRLLNGGIFCSMHVCKLVTLHDLQQLLDRQLMHPPAVDCMALDGGGEAEVRLLVDAAHRHARDGTAAVWQVDLALLRKKVHT